MLLKWLNLSVLFFSIYFLGAMENDLLYAVRHRKIELLEKLFHQNSAQVNMACSEGDTPLILLCHWRTAQATTIAKRLIVNGADINHQNKDGVTALILAAVAGNKEMVEFLLDEGALDLPNNAGGTALHLSRVHPREELTTYIAHKAYKQKLM